MTYDIRDSERTLSEKEKKLIEIIRKVDFGEVVIHLENKEPVRIEKIKQSIKL